MAAAKKYLDSLNTKTTLSAGGGTYAMFSLPALEQRGVAQVSRLPFCIKVLLENLLRQEDGRLVEAADVEALARWNPHNLPDREIPFTPSRVLLQDFTGVPVLVDLASMRDAAARFRVDPALVNPVIPADLVIDHSVQVDAFGSATSLATNVKREYERNRERYAFMRWGQRSLRNFRVVPPATGIVHQVNLEYLASVVEERARDGETLAFPDTLVGTDSHTTMINGLGVVGWGVGGIEAEAAMLGHPMTMLMPEVIGFKLHGRLSEGATATDLVLTVTQILRRRGVVGKFVEFYGTGLSSLSLADRATIANMSPEYGATIGFFPVDAETLKYLTLTGRSPAHIALVEAYCKAQSLFRTDTTPDPWYTDTLELDLATVEPSLAGPKRPQDRVALSGLKENFKRLLVAGPTENGFGITTEAVGQQVAVKANGHETSLHHGSVVIAAITSCTNTSNPSVMVAAGLLARNAVQRGLTVDPSVKTSLAPGSRVVTDYLNAAGLMPYLEQLRFNLVGYGCTTCIGNSGPLPEPVARGVKDGDLVVVSVLSGNRNFEGRINPLTKASYLASPPLVVAYALAGRVDVDLTTEPLGKDNNGQPVYLREIWPSLEEINRVMLEAVRPEMFQVRYAEVFNGDENWRALPGPEGDRYAWDPDSTYIRLGPYFDGIGVEPAKLTDIMGARVLALLGDSVTTDHISPAGSIPAESPAGKYLIAHGVEPKDFNSYGSRRGNHEVMIRGTFANIRLRNLLAPGTEGGYTLNLLTGEQTTIYEASLAYRQAGVPLIVIAGTEYGSGSSRDWAAKGTVLLGVRAVIATSFERIHRSNLVEMGVLPLEFLPGENRETFRLTGKERFDIAGISAGLSTRQRLTANCRREDGSSFTFQVIARLDTKADVEYYSQGGILPAVLRQLRQMT